MALHAKAKAEAGYRFYALYDKISREDILAHAYAQCRSNKGAPGVDGQDFADIEAYGVQRWLGELALALRQETYRPDPIRRVFIPKANGKLRPLGISTLRDRVCMTAAMLVLEPIFEADLPPEQYAYRPGRNAQQAVVEVEELLFRGHPEVVDADLADYFGSIPHAELLKSVARRIVDRRVLHLIKMWLECPVEETDDRGRKTRTTEARDKRRGIPQGSPISPLLANLYMRRFVLGWKKLGLERSLGTRIVTYADDLVILCRKGKAEEALAATARDHGQAEAHGQRGEDTNLQGAGRRVRLPGLHVRADVFSENRPGAPGIPAIEEEHQAHGRERPCADRPIGDLARDHRAGGQVEPHAARMGELLRSRHRHQSVPGDRQLHRDAVAPVVAHQAQGQATQGRDLSTLAPLWALRARTPNRAWARRAVGEGVKSCPRAGCGKSACPVVCPAKAGVFSRRQTCRGKSQAPRSLDGRVEGNQDSEAHRQGLPRGDRESPGRNESERESGLENAWIRGPSPQLKGEGSMGCRNLTDAASRSRRGGSDSTVTRTCQATGEALLVPARNHRSKVDRITGATGKSIDGERVADGSACSDEAEQCPWSEGALLFVTSPAIREARTR